MQSFVDETRIVVSSGHGGHGSVSFRREKYVPYGGPDGGDGGRGGDVIFEVRSNVKTLYHLKTKHSFSGRDGGSGRGKRMHGKDGESVIITVPPGTIIKDAETQEIYIDFSRNEDGHQWKFLKGGKGGWGNWHFRTSVQQAPKYAHDGLPGQSCELIIELNLIADIGLVGFPNAGKSSLLKALTNANPKIAPYPFTTKIPNLGVFRIYDRDIVIADIPGIIQGASHGLGLGYQFLKHIARTSFLVFLIDLSDENYLSAFKILLNELQEYTPDLVSKKRLIVGTKIDLPEALERWGEFKLIFKDELILSISSFSGEGMEELKKSMVELTELT